MTTGRQIVGAVLCGGASRRMGRDKALIERDGVPLAVRVADALLAGGSEHVCAIGGDAAGLAAWGLEVVPDRYPGEGPLGGLATALATAPTDALLVLAPCDLLDPDPDVTSTLLRALSSAPDEVDAAVPVIAGRDEWVLSVWRVSPEILAAVDGLLAAGARRMDAADAVADAVRVPGLTPLAAADADRPEDLA